MSQTADASHWRVTETETVADSPFLLHHIDEPQHDLRDAAASYEGAAAETQGESTGFADPVAVKGPLTEVLSVGIASPHLSGPDPYRLIRPALAPAHAHLTADEIAINFGRTPAVVALHQALASPQPQQAALAVLLGRAGRRSVRVHGSDIAIPAYLHLLSRLCHEAAEHSEQELEVRIAPSASPSLLDDREGPTVELDVPITSDTARGRGDGAAALRLAIEGGEHNENHLTDLVFFGRHPELPRRALDTHDPRFARLTAEWSSILNLEVWQAIQAASANADLVVSGAEVADLDRFFWGRDGKRLAKLVEDAAREVAIDPGLLGAVMMAETRRPASYLSSDKVSSYHIGTDDFFEGRAAIAARVPAFAKVAWDRTQEPVTHDNDAKTKSTEGADDLIQFRGRSRAGHSGLPQVSRGTDARGRRRVERQLRRFNDRATVGADAHGNGGWRRRRIGLLGAGPAGRGYLSTQGDPGVGLPDAAQRHSADGASTSSLGMGVWAAADPNPSARIRSHLWRVRVRRQNGTRCDAFIQTSPANRACSGHGSNQ